MLMTITTTHRQGSALSYLLHKHPDKCQSFDLSFGEAHVFYPEVSDDRTTAALLLDVDPVGMVRGRPGSRGGGPLDQYVNDRPYVVSSLMSVAIAQVFGTALQGRCPRRPELVNREMPLTVGLHVVPCRGGPDLLRRLFEPLGYALEIEPLPLDPTFADFDASPYFQVTLRRQTPLHQLLNHLYVLIPVLDNYKHYYVGDAELAKLLRKGDGWLAAHPEKALISRRYLKYRGSLAKRAMVELRDEAESIAERTTAPADETEADADEKIDLNKARQLAVIDALKTAGVIHVMDLGCGEGRLLKRLMRDKAFGRILGMDVSTSALSVAAERLRLHELPERQRRRLALIHGSLIYRDARLSGYDGAAVVEVVEHLNPFRLAAFERVLFEFAKPKVVVLTTPNREYNSLWPHLGDRLRHRDHRFEWTRDEFAKWIRGVAERFGYTPSLFDIGSADPKLGPPTQGVRFILDDEGSRP